ncbi:MULTISPECIES: hypothetical protein [unclassified Streptomyces]|uniref:hypothetical protein n=1 Tax=unclassified Streptomyces TaxID=2593676 RepID=UPI002E328423|nr:MULTISPECIES: hypothetical protein [unclassified Streptomyces]WUC67820.1 hypothetical protein OG861_28320 [Streptomyces sp. NBC_00539]
MARLSVEGAEIVVRLSMRERLAVRRRHHIRVPVAAVREVAVETSWWRVLRGTAGRGSWHPGHCVGIRRSPEGGGGEDFVSVRARGPVLRLELAAGAEFRRIALSIPDPQATARRLRSLRPEDPAPDGAGRQEEARAPQAPHRPLLQHEGGTADDHGRAPGDPSRTGTGAQPKADDERVRRADEGE